MSREEAPTRMRNRPGVATQWCTAGS